MAGERRQGTAAPAPAVFPATGPEGFGGLAETALVAQDPGSRRHLLRRPGKLPFRPVHGEEPATVAQEQAEGPVATGRSPLRKVREGGLQGTAAPQEIQEQEPAGAGPGTGPGVTVHEAGGEAGAQAEPAPSREGLPGRGHPGGAGLQDQAASGPGRILVPDEKDSQTGVGQDPVQEKNRAHGRH